jgi:endonuclease G, mitochondrial
MTNMVPQSPKNNQHTWKSLEEYCRTLALKGNELYIICGPEGKGGVGSKSPAVVTELNAPRPNGGSGKIVVPNETWKVVLILPKGKTSPKDVTSAAKTIAVIMPNTQNLENDWKSSKGNYICTVNDVEKLTGYKFFSEVDPTVAKALKSQKFTPAK